MEDKVVIRKKTKIHTPFVSREGEEEKNKEYLLTIDMMSKD